MPFMPDELVNLDNQVLSLMTVFDSKSHLNTNSVIDAICNLLEILKSSGLGAEIQGTDFESVIKQLSDLHQITSKAKIGLEIINPVDVLKTVQSILTIFIPSGKGEEVGPTKEKIKEPEKKVSRSV